MAIRETHLIQNWQTCKLGLIIVIRQLFPQELLKTSYSIMEGVFCRFADSAISIREVYQIEKKLKEWILGNPDIAVMILQQQRALRVLLISGPSSSGKTTFAQRLSTQLSVNGLKPVTLAMDDYFVNREVTPLTEDGKPDFDCLEALDLPYLQQQLGELINGKTIETPIYDFKTGHRSTQTRRLRVGHDEILVVEGIHALNPLLFLGINRNMLFKVYLSSLFQLNFNLENRVPSSEVRLIRRIVRGDQFRGTHPEDTLDQWENVRRGEYKNVFKFQEESDVMFNSSLLYELNAMRPLAEASLNKIDDNSPYVKIRDRLLNILSFCEPMNTEKVPFNSILREFIGGSIYFD